MGCPGLLELKSAAGRGHMMLQYCLSLSCQRLSSPASFSPTPPTTTCCARQMQWLATGRPLLLHRRLLTANLNCDCEYLSLPCLQYLLTTTTYRR